MTTFFSEMLSHDLKLEMCLRNMCQENPFSYKSSSILGTSHTLVINMFICARFVAEPCWFISNCLQYILNDFSTYLHRCKRGKFKLIRLQKSLKYTKDLLTVKLNNIGKIFSECIISEHCRMALK